MLTPKFHAMVQALKVLPGVGPKTAARMAIELIERKPEAGLKLAGALQTGITEIQHCRICRSYADEEVCTICTDPKRDESMLCVVESVSDVMAIEDSGGVRGRYFVLGGHLSPLDGIGMEQIGLPQLFDLVKNNQALCELIIATNATVEGQATAHFIQQRVRQIALAQSLTLKVSRLAQGVPMGGELEYIDGLTLSQALKDRFEAK